MSPLRATNPKFLIFFYENMLSLVLWPAAGVAIESHAALNFEWEQRFGPGHTNLGPGQNET